MLEHFTGLLFTCAFLIAKICADGPAYFDFESRANSPDSYLTTRFFDPERYKNTDFALVFDGQSHVAQPVNLERDETINLSRRSFTIELWLRHNRQPYQSYPSFFITQGSTERVDSGERLLIGFKEDHTLEYSFYSGIPLVTAQHWLGDRGQWHHWAFTYDDETRERAAYRDGVLVGRDIASTRLTADGGLRFGHGYLTDMSKDTYFNGAVDELRIWRKVLSEETIRTYASLTSAWITDFHPDAANLVAYYSFDEGYGDASEDTSPAKLHMRLGCGPDREACGGSAGWWREGVGSVSLKLGGMHRIHKICPTPAVAHLDQNNTQWARPEYDMDGVIRPLPYCTTDLQHRHEVICSLQFTMHIAYQAGSVEGHPRYFVCDGLRWMPVFYDHHIWNDMILPS